MAVLPIYELTVFDDDDTTELFDVSTDPAHARPYLQAPTGWPEQEVDFAKGAASIGQLNVEVVDVRQTATDQATGYLTAQLADAGYSALNGHRALLTEDLGGGPTTVLDGVIRSVQLLDTFATYQLELRDIRERERRAKAFATTTTPTIFPRGVLNGYGPTISIPFFGGNFQFPVAPTQPLQAFYRQQSATRGYFELLPVQPNFQVFPWLGTKQKEAIDSTKTAIIGGVERPDILEHDLWQVLWRDTSAGGAYATITRIAHTHPDLPGGVNEFAPYLVFQNRVQVIRVNNEISGDTLPANGQDVDFILQYIGPPTPDWPHHIEGLTAGEYLRNLYRGDYSEEDPRIRYNEAALLALATPIRGRLPEPIDDIRAHAEEHVYPIVHAAPTLNAAGEIAPVTYILPDPSVTLVDLNDTNCRPAGGGWAHGTEDAVNLVKVAYRREFRRTPDQEVDERTAGDIVEAREVTIERRVQASIDLLGESPLEIDSMFLTAVGSADGKPVFGDLRNELGHQVAQRVAHMATDRFAQGGQYFRLEGNREVADIEGLDVGSWVTVSVSWMPDYVSGERGLSRLAQVMARRNRSPSWAQLTLLDAGSDQAPFGQPTLGTLTVATDGAVTVPIATVAVGSEARVDYAFNATEPAANSELWTFAGRAAAGASVITPPNPEDGTVWIRARGEGEGRRPSAYIAATSIGTNPVARIVDAELVVDDDGIVTVRWVGNNTCAALRLFYEIHTIGTEPTFPAANRIDVDDADDTYQFTTLTPLTLGWQFSLSIEPTNTWNPTTETADGLAGPRYTLEIPGELGDPAPAIPPFDDLEIFLPLDEGVGLTLRDRSGLGRDASPAATSPAAVTWDRGAAKQALVFPGAGAGYRLLTDAQLDTLMAGESYFSFWMRVTTTVGDASAYMMTRRNYILFELNQSEAFPQDLEFGFPGAIFNFDDVITSGVWHFILGQMDRPNDVIELWHAPLGGELTRLLRWEELDPFGATNRDLYLGSNGTTGDANNSNNFTGRIDDVRVGAGFLTRAQIWTLFRMPGVHSHTDDVTRPNVRVEVDQVGFTGTLTLVIDDPSNVVTATAFQPILGAGDFDLSTDPSTWALFDTTAPFTLSDTVAIAFKHTSRIGWAVRYTDEQGNVVWIRGVETFDPDEIAELTGFEIGFQDDGTVVINWSGDEDWDTGYVTADVDADPAIPTAAVNDGELVGRSGSLILDGTGGTTLVQAEYGQEVRVRVLPETGASVAGIFRRRRGDTEFVPPRVEAEWDRDAQGDATLRLIVTDPSGAITSSPQFSTRAGSQSGDNWSALGTGWDTGPTAAPWSGTYTFTLTVPDGEEVGIRWVITWTDENGDTRTIGDTHYSSRIDELSTTVYYPYAWAQESVTDAPNSNFAFGYLRPINTNDPDAWIITFTLPVGVRITDYAARLYRQTTSDQAVLGLRRLDNTGAFTTLGSTRTHATTGWATLTDSGPNYLVATEDTFQAFINLTGVVSPADARFLYLSVTFTRHNYAEEL